MPFKHEELECYQVGIELLRMVHDAQISPNLADAISCTFQGLLAALAHAESRRSFKDRRRWFELARGRAAECIASIDVLQNLHVLDNDKAEQAREKLKSIAFPM